MTKALRILLALTLPLTAATACEPMEPQGIPGALHGGGFTYCDAPSANCESEELPDGIAVGATFGLSYSGGGRLSSSNEHVLRTFAPSDQDGPEFLALEAGDASVLALETDETVLDYLDLSLVTPSAIRFHACADEFNSFSSSDLGVSPCISDVVATTLVVSRGSSLAPTVCAVPVAARGEDLSGSVPVTWTVSANSAAELELHVGRDSRCATIGGLTLGTASVRATTAALSATLNVEVSP